MVSTFMSTELSMKATGKTTYKMDKEWNLGKMEAGMKADTKKV